MNGKLTAQTQKVTHPRLKPVHGTDGPPTISHGSGEGFRRCLTLYLPLPTTADVALGSAGARGRGEVVPRNLTHLFTLCLEMGEAAAEPSVPSAVCVR